MKLDLEVNILIGMDHMIVNVPNNPTNNDIIKAVTKQIASGLFEPNGLAKLMYIGNNKNSEVYYDA